MLFISGSIIVIVSVLGGYAALGGKLMVLWQPFEVVIICGSAFGAYMIANPKTVLAKIGSALGQILKGPRHTKESYLELLSLLYAIFRLAKSKGMLTLEQHVENPEESELFRQFPLFFADKHALGFLCDYLRMMVLGSENPYEMEPLMDEEIETHHAEQMNLSDSIRTVADALPALGIVAAVLGIIRPWARSPSRRRCSASSSAAPWWGRSWACFCPTVSPPPWPIP